MVGRHSAGAEVSLQRGMNPVEMRILVEVGS